METITQTNRTILFAEINPERLNHADFSRGCAGKEQSG